MNIDNLKKLADYLLTGNLKAKFDMGRFSEFILFSRGPYFTTCGSVGCAIGHGPYAGIEKYKQEDWSVYSERVFEIDSWSPEYNWCFHGRWARIDNTPEGAGKRILWLLEHGLPENWNEQMRGEAKLCYL